ncbi:MAG: ATP synthase A1 subunit C, partial [Candidatus Methanomethylophilaceae archaeon]
KGKGGKGNYPYAVARVKAKKAQLMGEDTYSKMLMMSLPEISRFIGESGYQKEIAALAGRYDGVDLIEHATYSNMANYFRGVLDVTTGELHEMLAAYLEKWDIWNFKVILRGKSFGMDADSIREDLVPAGKLDQQALERLLSMESEEEIIAAYGRVANVIFPTELISAYEESRNLSELEDFLEKDHYDSLLRSIDPSSRPTRLYQDYIRKEIDITNVETILKLKAEGIRGEEVMKYIIPGGKQIDKKLATQLANAESLSAAVNDLAPLDFYDDIKNALDETNSLRSIVAGMKKYHIRQAKTFSHLYPLSVIPIIDFMIHKENEVNNIRIIARGLNSGLDADVIKELLVI